MEQSNFLDKLCNVLEVPTEERSNEEKTITVMQIIKLMDIIRCSEISSNLMKVKEEEKIKDALLDRTIKAEFIVNTEIIVNGNTVPADVIERTLLLKKKLDKFEEEMNEEEREFFVMWKETICKLKN